MGSVSMNNIKKVCEIYNGGFTAIKGIASMLGLHTSTVTIALQKGKELGLCNYVPNKRGKINIGFKDSSKKVYCFNNDKIYNSITDCAIETKCNRNDISDICKGKKQSVEVNNNKYRFKFV